MTDIQIKNLLKAIGISSGIILIILGIYFAATLYKNYLETEKLKLQIVYLKKSIKDPAIKPQPLSPIEGGFKSSQNKIEDYLQGLPRENKYGNIV